MENMLAVAMFGLGPQEFIIIGVIVIVLFGAKRIPELGSSVGLGIKNFKKGLRQAQDEEDEEAKALPKGEAKEVAVIEASSVEEGERS